MGNRQETQRRIMANDETISLEPLAQDLHTSLTKILDVLEQLSKSKENLYDVPQILIECQKDLKAISEKIILLTDKVEGLHNLQTEQLRTLPDFISSLSNRTDKIELSKSIQNVQNILDMLTEQNKLLGKTQGISNKIKEIRQEQTQSFNERCQTMLNTIKELPNLATTDREEPDGRTVHNIEMISFPSDTLNGTPDQESRIEALEQLTQTIKDCNLLLNDLKTISVKIEKKDLIKKLKESTEVLNTLTRNPRIKDLKMRNKYRLQTIDDMRIGMEISFQRTSFEHNAITLRINATSQTFEVMHLTLNSVVSSSSASMNSSSRGFTALLKQWMEFGENGKIMCYDYKKTNIPKEIVVRRAQIVYEELHNFGKSYDLLRFNCQHFASYCMTGAFFSGDVDKIVSFSPNDDLRRMMNTCVCRHILEDLKEQYTCLL